MKPLSAEERKRLEKILLENYGMTRAEFTDRDLLTILIKLLAQDAEIEQFKALCRESAKAMSDYVEGHLGADEIAETINELEGV